MNRIPLSIPEVAVIAGTRAALGAGMGLLLADRLDRDQRRAIGWTLFAVGAVSTAPILVQLLTSAHSASTARLAERPAPRPAEPEYAS
jgi:hypothetical protein